MNQIDKLITKYSKEKVVLKKISDIAELSRGVVMSKDFIREHQGDYPVYSSQTENNGELGKIDSYMYDGEFLTWTTDGANAGSIFYRTGKFNITNVCGLIKITDDSVNARYLYYYLQTAVKPFVNRGMGNPKLMSNVMERVPVKIPSLEVQGEIVRILDNFAELTAELTAELSLRKSQYDFYLNSLLDFKDKAGGAITNWKKVFELFTFKNGVGHERCVSDDGIYTIVNSKFISSNGVSFKRTNELLCPLIRNDILMVMSDLPNGKALAKCFIVSEDNKYSLNQRICALHANEKFVDTRFAYYWLNRNRQLLRYDNGVDQTNLKKETILNVDFPLINIEKQREISNILDKFNEISESLFVGLPAEIQLRQKQYAYYRDKLLAFN